MISNLILQKDTSILQKEVRKINEILTSNILESSFLGQLNRRLNNSINHLFNSPKMKSNSPKNDRMGACLIYYVYKACSK
jgi:hypothetical protein